MRPAKEAALKEALLILKSEKKELEDAIENLIEKRDEKEKEIIFIKRMLGG